MVRRTPSARATADPRTAATGSRRIAPRRSSLHPAGQGGRTRRGFDPAATASAGPPGARPRRSRRSRRRPSAAGEPALDGADRPAQVSRGLLVGAALEVAEDDGRAITLGKPVDLLVQEPLELDVRLGPGLPVHRRLSFEAAMAGRGGPGTRRGPVGDLVQPGAERIAHPEPAGPLHQDQERGLERILDVVVVRQYAPADPHDHRPVTLDQDREGQLGGLAPLGRESLQELTVGQLADRTDVEERPELPPDGPVLTDAHRWDPPPDRSSRCTDISNVTTAAEGSTISSRTGDFNDRPGTARRRR